MSAKVHAAIVDIRSAMFCSVFYRTRDAIGANLSPAKRQQRPSGICHVYTVVACVVARPGSCRLRRPCRRY